MRFIGILFLVFSAAAGFAGVDPWALTIPVALGLALIIYSFSDHEEIGY